MITSYTMIALCTGAVALTLGNVPDGAGQIWLDNVNCRGTETRLVDCPANPLGNHNCVHAEDAGVRCGQQGCNLIIVSLFFLTLTSIRTFLHKEQRSSSYVISYAN